MKNVSKLIINTVYGILFNVLCIYSNVLYSMYLITNQHYLYVYFQQEKI